jgi:hypothetical protein
MVRVEASLTAHLDSFQTLGNLELGINLCGADQEMDVNLQEVLDFICGDFPRQAAVTFSGYY